MNHVTRRFGYVLLCLLPILAVVLAGMRPLRIPGFYPVFGGALFALVVATAGIVGANALKSANVEAQRLALVGTLLLASWALIVLLWVGIGAPFQATGEENHGRFLVLISNSLLVMSGFIALYRALAERREHMWPTLGFAAATSAGVAYFALALGSSRLLKHGPALAYDCQRDIRLAVGLRGIAYPEISGQTAPWYSQPAVIAGIPAIPWIMPGMFAAVLLRRAGDGSA